MTFGDFSAIKPIEIAPGYHARFIHTDTHTFSYVEIEPGKPIPMHSHPHEQISLVQEGEFELTVGDETRVCAPNVPVLIQGDVVHGAVNKPYCKPATKRVKTSLCFCKSNSGATATRTI